MMEAQQQGFASSISSDASMNSSFDLPATASTSAARCVTEGLEKEGHESQRSSPDAHLCRPYAKGQRSATGESWPVLATVRGDASPNEPKPLSGQSSQLGIGTDVP
jgi:hypothetical protein